MAKLWYGHFDSTPTDPREMTAEVWARYIRSMVSDGIRNGGTCLQITSGDGNTVKMDTGIASIQGYIFTSDEDDRGRYYDIDAPTAHPSLSRIDRVVLRLNRKIQYRTVAPDFKLGIAAEAPVPPELERDNEVWELSLARIIRKPGAVAIVPEDITDERMDDAVCGLMNSVLGLDSSAWQKQFDDFLAHIKALDEAFLISQRQKFDASLNEQATGWQTQMSAQQGEYIAEYNRLMALYSTLQNDITKLQVFDFNNLAALNKVRRVSIRSPDKNTVTEVITDRLTGLKIAERVTTRLGKDNITEVTRIFATDGVSVFKESTVAVTRSADGSITETADGFNDYSLAAAYAMGKVNDSANVAYNNTEYAELANVEQGLNVALQVVKEISWK